jgi:hypothetical protein
MASFNDIISRASKMNAEGVDDNSIDQYLQTYGLSVDDEGVASAVRAIRKGIELPEPGVGRQAAQGTTFGFADELEGLWESATGDLDYGEARDIIRAGNTAYATQNPGTALAAETAGAVLVPGLGWVKGLGTAGRGAWQMAKQGAKVGGAEGALYSAGASEANPLEQPGEFAKDVGVGTLIGTGAGGVAQPVLGKTLERYSARARTPEERTARVLTETLGGEEGIDEARRAYLERVAAETADARSAGVEPRLSPMLADVNELARREARKVRTQSPEAQQVIDPRLDARYLDTELGTATDVGQAGRVRQTLRGVGGRPGEGIEEMVERRGREADIDYELSRLTDPDVPALTIIDDLQDPHFRKAYEKAVYLNRADIDAGKNVARLPDFDDLDADTAIPIQSIDYIKRGVDDYLGTSGNVQGMGKQERRAVQNRLRRFLNRIDQGTEDYPGAPMYAEARQRFASTSELINAGEAGRHFLDRKVTSGDVRDVMRGMDPPAAQAYKQQALEMVYNQLDNISENRDVVKAMFGKRADREKLRVLLGDRGYEQLRQRMIREAEQVRTRQFVMGGSQTADKLADMKNEDAMFNLAIDILAESATTGAPVVSGTRALARPLKETLRKAGQKFRTPQARRSQLARAELLTETDPARVEAGLRALPLANRARAQRGANTLERWGGTDPYKPGSVLRRALTSYTAQE